MNESKKYYFCFKKKKKEKVNANPELAAACVVHLLIVLALTQVKEAHVAAHCPEMSVRQINPLLPRV